MSTGTLFGCSQAVSDLGLAIAADLNLVNETVLLSDNCAFWRTYPSILLCHGVVGTSHSSAGIADQFGSKAGRDLQLRALN